MTASLAPPALAYGIDLGASRLRVALVDGTGAVSQKRAVATDVAGGPEGVLKQIADMTAEIAAASGRRPAVAGLSSPGPLDSDTGTVLTIATLPGWDDFPVRARLSERLEMPVALENDGLAAAVGEWQFGAGRGLLHMVYVTVSTGIGGGVVSDGRLLRGRRGMAGHVGHMIIQPGGPRQGEGAPGTFEAMASGTALSRVAREAGYADAAALVAAVRAGDAAAQTVLDREADWLGSGFTSLLHLYSPEKLVVGGGTGQALDLMLPRIRQRIEDLALPPFRTVPIVPAELGDNAGLVGAAALALTLSAPGSG